MGFSGTLSRTELRRRRPRRRPALTTASVVGVVAVLTAVAVVGVVLVRGVGSAGTARRAPLAVIGPAQLVSRIGASAGARYSGTIVANVSLALPALVRRAALADDADDTALDVLLDGTHTLQVWSSGRSRQRLELLANTFEIDVVRDGTDVWEWDSVTRAATHARNDRPSTDLPALLMSPDELAPPTLARLLVGMLAGSAEVVLRAGDDVAGRSTYELILTPRAFGSRIAEVRVEVDGTTSLPLGVQVFAHGSQAPTVDVGFTDVSFRAPSVDALAVPSTRVFVQAMQNVTQPAPTRVGASPSAWLDVAEYAGSPLPPLVKALPPAKARLLTTPLLSAMVLPDGKVLVGAVDPWVLNAAAGAVPTAGTPRPR